MLFSDLKVGMRFMLSSEDDDGSEAVECAIIDAHMLENGLGLMVVHFDDALGTSVAGWADKPLHNFMKPMEVTA